MITPPPIEMAVGTLIEYRLRLRGVPVRWLTRIEAWDPPRRLIDNQLRGPCALWHHTHEFEPDGDRTVIRDQVLLGLIAARARATGPSASPSPGSSA